MSTICGDQYIEIDQIACLIEEHLTKYGEDNMSEALERIFLGVQYGLKNKLQVKK